MRLLIISLALLINLSYILSYSALNTKKCNNHQLYSIPKTNKQIEVNDYVNNYLNPLVKSFSILSTVYLSKVLPVNAETKTQLEFMPALQGLDYGKPRTFYPDYLRKPSGLQYKLVKEGTGVIPEKGDRVAVDWEGYTIGYYGRPFQTRNKVKGGAFDSTETDYFRWTVGSGSVIKALDEVVTYLPEGSVAQVVIPPELGYPVTGDSEHDLVGPKPNTFSGLRALNFVLENQNLIDKTLLINVKVIRVDKKKKA